MRRLTFFFSLVFLFSVQLRAFNLFPENGCPTLNASQLCQISGDRNKKLKPDYSSKILLRNACHLKHGVSFEGTSKGAICECHYHVPEEWNIYPPHKPLSLIIYTRSPKDFQIGCPKLSFRAYDILAKGHTFEDNSNKLWRTQTTLFSPLPKRKTLQPIPREGPLFINATKKQDWIICRYAFNDLPITIRIKNGSTKRYHKL